MPNVELTTNKVCAAIEMISGAAIFLLLIPIPKSQRLGYGFESLYQTDQQLRPAQQFIPSKVINGFAFISLASPVTFIGYICRGMLFMQYSFIYLCYFQTIY